MSKNDVEKTRFYMSDATFTRVLNARRGAYMFWAIASIGSFWIYDWNISWGQVTTFVGGAYFGYAIGVNWIKIHAGRMEL